MQAGIFVPFPLIFCAKAAIKNFDLCKICPYIIVFLQYTCIFLGKYIDIKSVRNAKNRRKYFIL
jgi:hypothetical protein